MAPSSEKTVAGGAGALFSRGNDVKQNEAGKQAAAAGEGKKYRIEQVIDGEVFVSEVSILGVPLWLPQKPEAQHPQSVVGQVLEIVTLPPNEELGSAERDAIVLKTKTGSHWKCPVNEVLKRQFAEMRTPAAGDWIAITFEGKARKGKGSKQPANLFRMGFLSAERTAELKKAQAAEAAHVARTAGQALS